MVNEPLGAGKVSRGDKPLRNLIVTLRFPFPIEFNEVRAVIEANLQFLKLTIVVLTIKAFFTKSTTSGPITKLVIAEELMTCINVSTSGTPGFREVNS